MNVWMFQSLFYWISRCGPRGRRSRLAPIWCFNPCSIGLAVAAPRVGFRSRRPSSGFNPCSIGLAVAAVQQAVDALQPMVFQSLFYWISRCGWHNQRAHDGQ